MKLVFRVMILVLVGVLTAYSQQARLFDSFEAAWTNGGTTPAGWTRTNVAGSGEWGQRLYPLTGQQPPTGNIPYAGRAVAWFAANQPAGTSTRLESPSVDFSSAVNPYLKFSLCNKTGTDTLWVQTSTDGGSTWTTVTRYVSGGDWIVRRVSLPQLAGLSNVKVGLLAVADSGTSDIWLDQLVLSGRVVTVREIQEIPPDWLLLADTLQFTAQTRWRLQSSPLEGDTLTVTGLCVIPAKVITYTAQGFDMILYDTADVTDWRALFVRVNSPTDSAQATLDGFLNVQAGDIIALTGVVSEFPTGTMSSLTQFQPIPGISIPILGSMVIPAPPQLSASTFYSGIFPGGTIPYSTAEPYENAIIEMSNLVVDLYVNAPNGTFDMVQNGNTVSDYDVSKWFTFRAHLDSSSTYTLPPLGSTIELIRGSIWIASGGENTRGYRVGPMYPGDLVVGASLPRVTAARRAPVVVSSANDAQVTVRTFKQEGGYDIGSVHLLYSVNDGPFVDSTMTLVNTVDSTYQSTIPPQAANTVVRYFFRALDNQNNEAILASFASSGGNDTTKGFFWYTVLDRPLTIRDIQYTPYSNGYSPYAQDSLINGALVSVSAIATVDTTNFLVFPRSSVGGTYAWYMQSTSQPWSGIWITALPGADSIMMPIRMGDSITVTGNVQEWPSFSQNVTTKIGNIQSVVIHGSGNPAPAPLVFTTGRFSAAASNGDSLAEPYEGMLVKFLNVTVTDTFPYFSDPSQYEINDGSGALWVHRDGRNTFTNIVADSVDPTWHVIRQNDLFDSITGIIHFSVNRYKFVPRGNPDFEVPVGVIVRRDVLPKEFDLAQNYPNPFNPTTTVVYDIPKSSLVSLKIYNILGQEVATLVNEEQTAGRYVVPFNASALASGVYFYRLTAANYINVKKMLLLK